MSDGVTDLPIRRGLIIFEIVAVLTLFYVPTLVYGIESYLLRGPHGTNLATSATAALWNRSLTWATLIAFILFIVWRGAGSLRGFGLGLGVRWGGALVIPVYFSIGAISWVGEMATSAGPDGPPFASMFIGSAVRHGISDPAHIFATVVHLVLGVFLEDFVMRGYLIRRLEQLSVRPWASVLISSAMFASYHVYQGLPRTIIVFMIGLLLAGTLRLTRSIWPGFMAHFAIDALIELGRMGAIGIR